VNTIPFDELEARLLVNPEVKAEYDALEQEYAIARELIAARAGLSQAQLSAAISAARKELVNCDSYSRLPCLLDMAFWIDDDEWLALLGEQWSGFDKVGAHLDELLDSPFGLRLGEGAIKPMMNQEELSAFEALPDEFVVYRGCYAANKWGLSWTSKRETAAAFPLLNRYKQKGQPLLVKALAKKSEAAALKLDRDEDEIIIFRPRHISTSHIRTA